MSTSSPSLAVSPSFLGCSISESLELAEESRDWGYTSAWVDEVLGHEAFGLLGALTQRCQSFDLGVAVTPVQTRSAFVLARAAMTLSELTGGRFTLGIGASSEVLVARFGGQEYTKPLTYVREMATALRGMLDGERVSMQGEKVTVGGYKYPGSAPPVPLYLGSLNKNSLRLAGAVGDGVCLNQFGPQHLPQILQQIRIGAEDAGRTLDHRGLPEEYGVMARLMTVVTDDPDVALDALRTQFAPYAATAGYNRFYRWIGYEEQAETIAAAAKVGDKTAMYTAYSREMARDVLVVGTRREVRDKITAYFDAGVTIAAIEPLSPGRDAVAATLQAAAVL